MARWKIVSGARPFYSFPGRDGIAVGWARDLQRGEEQFTVNVCVTQEAQDAGELPPEARDAIRSHGRSVINSLLTEDALPHVVDVTATGLVRDYESPEGEDDQERGGERPDEAQEAGPSDASPEAAEHAAG
jgi:hypothetical protein